MASGTTEDASRRITATLQLAWRWSGAERNRLRADAVPDDGVQRHYGAPVYSAGQRRMRGKPEELRRSALQSPLFQECDTFAQEMDFLPLSGVHAIGELLHAARDFLYSSLQNI